MQGSDTMKSWQLAVLGLTLLTIAGCRTDPNIPLLERELYRKDREINRLRWQIEDLQDVLNSGTEPSSRRDKPGDEREREVGPHHNNHESNGQGPPKTERGTPTDKVPDALNPDVTLPPGVPDVPDNIRNPTPEKSSGDGPELDGVSDRRSSRSGSVLLTGGQTPIPFSPSGDSRRVTSITIDPALTGGIGSGDTSGDRGLLVVVEPRDGAGRIVDAPAEVNVAVFDPALKGEAARVARWDFTPAETASLFCRTIKGPAIHLAMAWPANPPKHHKLHLFVRYIAANGRKLEANQPIEIALPGERTARWTPAETPRSAETPIQREPPPRSWRPSETPIARASEPTPYIASRTAEPKPERPVWSPERR
jgi:hypothetical protein